jgi:hypothetical protein
MKKIRLAIILYIAAIFLILPLALADQVDDLRQKMKDCQNGACTKQLQNETEEIFQKVSSNFNEEFAKIGKDITAKHCYSLIQEMFYHMEKLKLYSNYKDVFYLKKLKKLKLNRERIDRGEITLNDFKRLNKQVETQYQHDVQASQAFVDANVSRLHALLDNFNQNVEYLKGIDRMEDRSTLNSSVENITTLSNEKVWQDFISDSNEGNKIKTAILSASNNSGEDLIPKLKAMFSYLGNKEHGMLFRHDLISTLVNKYPIH